MTTFTLILAILSLSHVQTNSLKDVSGFKTEYECQVVADAWLDEMKRRASADITFSAICIEQGTK